MFENSSKLLHIAEKMAKEIIRMDLNPSEKIFVANMIRFLVESSITTAITTKKFQDTKEGG